MTLIFPAYALTSGVFAILFFAHLADRRRDRRPVLDLGRKPQKPPFATAVAAATMKGVHDH